MKLSKSSDRLSRGYSAVPDYSWTSLQRCVTPADSWATGVVDLTTDTDTCRGPRVGITWQRRWRQ